MFIFKFFFQFRSTQNDHHHPHQKEKHKENDQIVVPRVIPPFEQIKSNNNNREIDNNGNWNIRRKSFNNGNNGGPSPTVNNVPMRSEEQQEFIRGGQKSLIFLNCVHPFKIRVDFTYTLYSAYTLYFRDTVLKKFFALPFS